MVEVLLNNFDYYISDYSDKEQELAKEELDNELEMLYEYRTFKYEDEEYDAVKEIVNEILGKLEDEYYYEEEYDEE